MIAILLLTASTALAAEPAAPAPNDMTLDQALALARKNNRNLVVEHERLVQAQTTVEQAWSTLFPVIAAQGKYTRNYKAVSLPFGGNNILLQPLNQLDGAISGSIPILAPAAYPALDAVKKGVAASEANVKSSEASILFSVAQTFFLAAASDEVLLARKSNIDVAQATLANAQTRLAAGTVTKVDVDRAELSLLRAQQAERDARYGRDQAYRALGTLIQAQHPFQVRVPAEPVEPKGTAKDDFDLALRLRPELRSLELSALGYQAQSSAQAYRWAPTLSGFGNARIFNYDNFALDRHSWAVGAQLDWVIYDGGGRDAARHLANAQAAEALARADVLRDDIRDDIADARQQFGTKVQARDTANRSVELSTETLDLVRTQYEAGSATQLDLLRAQDELLASRVSLAQAHFDVSVADLTLRRANGTFPGQ